MRRKVKATRFLVHYRTPKGEACTPVECSTLRGARESVANMSRQLPDFKFVRVERVTVIPFDDGKRRGGRK